MSTKLRVAVLMGGPSAEREVSLKTGAMVLSSLDAERYAAFPFEATDLLGNPEAIARLAREADFAFLALHGSFGEDGTVQGLLDALGIPYQGSGVLASASALHKAIAKAVLRESGVPVARGLDFVAAPEGTWCAGRSADFGPNRPHETLSPESAARMLEACVPGSMGYVVKGASQGSTLGLELIDDAGQLPAALASILRLDPDVVVEERLSGRELTCGVLGGAEPWALPVIEIRPKAAKHFDFEAKYTPGASDELCPAPISEEDTAKVQALALLAHQAFGCWGLSRTDFILTESGPVALETNTLPGFTETSLVPLAARSVGIPFPELLDKLIAWGLERPGTRAPQTALLR